MTSADWPSPGDPVSSAIYRLARAHRALGNLLLRDLGLFTGQEIMLLEIAAQGTTTQRDVVRAMMLDHSTVAKSLRRLETGGLIARQPSAEDRRSMEVRLTDAGRDLLERIEGAWSEMEQATVAGLDDRERQVVVELMRRMEADVVARVDDVRERSSDASPER